MVTDHNIQEIINNNNPGFEYEIALFYCLLPSAEEKETVANAFAKRTDNEKIQKIIERTNTAEILNELNHRGLAFADCTLETQNDQIGPADIVMSVYDRPGNNLKIGLSVKYANFCNINISGNNFLLPEQVSQLKLKLIDYTKRYIDEMKNKYGDINNWFRKRKPSLTTDLYIDLIRDAVIKNWPNIKDKRALINRLYQTDSPIEFWIAKYTDHDFKLICHPFHADDVDIDTITVAKDQTSYIAFYHNGHKIGHMQVKFNNGFIERCKKRKADMIIDDVKISFGKPFTSWNFSIEK